MRKSKEILVGVVLGSAVVFAAFVFYEVVDNPVHFENRK